MLCWLFALQVYRNTSCVYSQTARWALPVCDKLHGVKDSKLKVTRMVLRTENKEKLACKQLIMTCGESKG